MSAPLTFVDAIGGGAARIGASLAQARGLEARALSSVPLQDRDEVATVLAEIGVQRVVEAQQGTPAGEGVVRVGPAPSDIDSPLYLGPDTTQFGHTQLERLALARIARDRIERWLETR